MAQLMSVEEAKKCALQLVAGLDLGNGTPAGLKISNGAVDAFQHVANSIVVEPLSGTRKSPSGKDMDVYAASPWHALCAVAIQDLVSRLIRSSYEAALATIDDTFGARPIYRGQPRAWDIVPSAWRSQRSAELSNVVLPKFRSALTAHLMAHPDPILRLMGRPGLDHAVDGLAQHYGLPTNLVDWTFNPLVAMGFACGDSLSEETLPRDLKDERLKTCAVVYAIGAPAMATAGQPTFEFPPSYSLRLYQQKGLFSDFGEYPGERAAQSLEDYSAEWCWLQQNCFRIFFPRNFPQIHGADELREHTLMDGDAFLAALADRVKNGLPAQPGNFAEVPPWFGADDDMEWMGSRAAEACGRIDAYVRRACLVKLEDADGLDPLLLGLLNKTVAPEINALSFFSELSGHAGLAWTAARIHDAKQALGLHDL